MWRLHRHQGVQGPSGHSLCETREFLTKWTPGGFPTVSLTTLGLLLSARPYLDNTEAS
jgi:hypothetical protein